MIIHDNSCRMPRLLEHFGLKVRSPMPFKARFTRFLALDTAQIARERSTRALQMPHLLGNEIQEGIAFSDLPQRKK